MTWRRGRARSCSMYDDHLPDTHLSEAFDAVRFEPMTRLRLLAETWSDGDLAKLLEAVDSAAESDRPLRKNCVTRRRRS